MVFNDKIKIFVSWMEGEGVEELSPTQVSIFSAQKDNVDEEISIKEISQTDCIRRSIIYLLYVCRAKLQGKLSLVV